MAEVEVDVFVVDSNDRPVSGAKVGASWKYSLWPGSWSDGYTDRDGHVVFSDDHPGRPVSVTLYLDGEEMDTYEIGGEVEAFTLYKEW